MGRQGFRALGRRILDGKTGVRGDPRPVDLVSFVPD